MDKRQVYIKGYKVDHEKIRNHFPPGEGEGSEVRSSLSVRVVPTHPRLHTSGCIYRSHARARARWRIEILAVMAKDILTPRPSYAMLPVNVVSILSTEICPRRRLGFCLYTCLPTCNNTGIGYGPTSRRMDPSSMAGLTGFGLQSRRINCRDEMPVVAKSQWLAHFAKLWRAENNVQYVPKGKW
jgi:hypothetical protein